MGKGKNEKNQFIKANLQLVITIANFQKYALMILPPVGTARCGMCVLRTLWWEPLLELVINMADFQN
jgi:hypothetical protein